MQKQGQSWKMGGEAKEAVLTALELISNNLNINFMLQIKTFLNPALESVMRKLEQHIQHGRDSRDATAEVTVPSHSMWVLAHVGYGRNKPTGFPSHCFMHTHAQSVHPRPQEYERGAKALITPSSWLSTTHSRLHLINQQVNFAH